MKELLDLAVTIELPDPNDPNLGGTLEHFIQLCDAVANKWAQDLQAMGVSVVRARVDLLSVSKNYPRNNK